jgi:hypothetical protein
MDNFRTISPPAMRLQTLAGAGETWEYSRDHSDDLGRTGYRYPMIAPTAAAQLRRTRRLLRPAGARGARRRVGLVGGLLGSGLRAPGSWAPGSWLLGSGLRAPGSGLLGLGTGGRGSSGVGAAQPTPGWYSWGLRASYGSWDLWGCGAERIQTGVCRDSRADAAGREAISTVCNNCCPDDRNRTR